MVELYFEYRGVRKALGVGLAGVEESDVRVSVSSDPGLGDKLTQIEYRKYTSLVSIGERTEKRRLWRTYTDNTCPREWKVNLET